MSQVNHITNVRPGDRWDGVALNIHKTSFDWSQAQVTVQLRLGARGPLVANVAFSQSAAVDTLVLGFYLTAADTAKLKLGSTYYGIVTVQIPNANPALEPTFGPYTLFTWAMEMSDRAQSGSATFRVEFGSATVFNIALNEGSTITISGGDGGGDGGGGGGAPSAHAATHRHGGSDEVATGTPSANAIPKADGNGKLDAWVSSGAVAGTPSLRSLGTGVLQACAGNDVRLSDARTPVAHTHPVGEVTGLGGAATLNVGTGPGTVCAGNDGRLSDARTPTAHTHPVGDITGLGGAATLNVGTGPSTVCAGNDARLSDSRTPTAHAASHRHGGADEVAVATPAANAIPKADGAGKLDAWITSGGAAATPSLRILGTAATDACAGNDSRLSNARTPTAHTHTASEVTDFAEAVDDRVAALLVAGSNITITYNDAGNTLTIASTSGGGGVASDPIFDAAGDLAVGTGPDASAKLPVGDYGTCLMSAGLGVTPFYSSPNNTFLMAEHFISHLASPTIFTEVLSSVSSNSGLANDKDHPGVYSLSTGASASSSGYLRVGNSSGTMMIGGGEIIYEQLIKLDAISDGAQSYTIHFGFFEASYGITTGGNHHIKLIHDASSANWQTSTKNNGTMTLLASTNAVVLGWNKLQIRIAANGSSVSFFVNGVQLSTSPMSVNMPDNNDPMSFGFGISKQLGVTPRLLHTDYVFVAQKLTTPS